MQCSSEQDVQARLDQLLKKSEQLASDLGGFINLSLFKGILNISKELLGMREKRFVLSLTYGSLYVACW